MFTLRPEPLPDPPTLLPASRPVPCSDTAVINALGKDDDNNDHN